MRSNEHCFVTESLVHTSRYIQLKNVPITNTVYSENKKEANQLFSETKLKGLSQIK